MLRRLRWKSLLTILIIVGVSTAALAVQEWDLGPLNLERGSDEVLGLQLGLDLAGGTHLVYQAGGPDFQPTPGQMDGLVATITRRVNRLGVTEPSIQKLGNDRLVIQLPGIEDVEQAKTLIGRTAQLEIVERVCFDRICDESAPGSFEDRPTGLTGAEMSRAFAGQDQVTGEPILLFELNRGAAGDFAQLTQRIFNTNGSASPDQLGFALDGEVIVAAGVISPILSGNGQISGNFSAEEVRQLAIQVESGRLPIPIEEISSTLVAASLGAKSLEDVLLAGAVGLALVLLFMVAYYRLAGLVAAVALVFYTVIVLAVFKVVPITLTLAGVAGFVLSLGIAVDANILIFERMKEELRIGRDLQFAIQIGFNRAWTSIRDGNISTLIIAAILFFFGSGSANSAVTGFAASLGIGVLISMFTAIFISRNLLAIVAGTGLRGFPRFFSPEGAPTTASGSQSAERGS
ncbi:MAG: protein translocase subunit SecD [Dehalococcoidia bacterium]